MSYPSGTVLVEHPAEGTAVAVFAGEHDLATADETRTLLTSLIDENGLVVVDLSDAEFVDSSTVFTLLLCHQAAVARGRTFRLQLGTAPIVERVLELSGVLKVLDCVPTREEALRR